MYIFFWKLFVVNCLIGWKIGGCFVIIKLICFLIVFVMILGWIFKVIIIFLIGLFNVLMCKFIGFFVFVNYLG